MSLLTPSGIKTASLCGEKTWTKGRKSFQKIQFGDTPRAVIELCCVWFSLDGAREKCHFSLTPHAAYISLSSTNIFWKDNTLNVPSNERVIRNTIPRRKYNASENLICCYCHLWFSKISSKSWNYNTYNNNFYLI